MTHEHGTPQGLAAWLVVTLQAQGATFTLSDDETGFLADLNPVPGLDHDTAERFALAILCVKDEITELLLADRITH